MQRLTRSSLRLGALALVLAGLAASSSAGSESGSYYKSFGNSKAGGSLSAQAHIYRNSSSSSARGEAYGKLRFLNKTIEGALAEAQGYSNFGSTSGSVRLRIAGSTVYSKYFNASKSFYKSTQLYVFNPAPTTVVTVGPVPVTVSGNVGAGGKLSGTTSLAVHDASVNLYGQGRAWANGWAHAGVGFPGYSAGLQVDAYFGNLQLDSNCKASAQSGLSGYSKLSVTPIELFLKAVLYAWPFQWSATLSSYTSNSYAKYLFH